MWPRSQRNSNHSHLRITVTAVLIAACGSTAITVDDPFAELVGDYDLVSVDGAPLPYTRQSPATFTTYHGTRSPSTASW